MQIRSIIILIFIGWHSLLFPQEKYLTKQGNISFYSHTPVEDIKAENKQVLSIVDLSTGEIAISILMKSFVFEKALMQEHFNENYVESDKFPKATFTGKIQNLQEVMSGDNGVAEVDGKLTIHGITKPVQIEARTDTENEKISLTGKFMITVADYDIKIPAIVRNNIAREVEVSFKLEHLPYR
ncbi:YceI family protein [Sinomicrobium weinanense]|uniref:YceI family protein n=1 Tax=Sinomicrobium weinanense TaxID=2842200 RepID=A0A926JV00_9FLAO|nr:YceI family protein [Sinomicrobium weinanense]MBC9797975.1 YceI family protein [Sinomicrobium weinanense]MBU3125508.1 YceI family protein [Sinomicrobium weinanense]